MELNSTEGEWTVGVEEKGAIGKRKLESGIGGVLWTMTTPVVRSGFGEVRPVGMTRLMRVIRLMRRTGPVRMTRFVRMVGLVGVIKLVGSARRMRRLRFTRMVRRFRSTRGRRMLGSSRVLGVTMLAWMLNLLWLGPLSVNIAFKFLVGIKLGLSFLSALSSCRQNENVPIRNHRGQRWGLRLDR